MLAGGLTPRLSFVLSVRGQSVKLGEGYSIVDESRFVPPDSDSQTGPGRFRIRFPQAFAYRAVYTYFVHGWL
jgi:hypothetical protein